MADDTKPVATPPAVPAIVLKGDDLVERWWADSVAAMQSSNWTLKVEAKEELKLRIQALLKGK